MNSIYLAVVLFSMTLTLGSGQINDCSPPWEKITKDMCILLNSGIKVWSHASLLCKFYQASLLYVQSEEEQIQLTKYVQPLIPFRFGLRPYIWLEKLTNDSVSSSNNGKDSWKWSNIDKQANYTNWLRKQDDGTSGELPKECVCFRVRDGAWRSCECSSIQHYICRKTDQPMSNKKQSSEESTTQREKSDLLEAASIVSSSSSEAASSSFINIVRIKIRKSSYQFRHVECPLGFGYYTVPGDSHCTRYKLCQNWDNIYGFVVMNRCLDGMVFNFEAKRCVPASTYTCQQQQLLNTPSDSSSSFYPL